MLATALLAPAACSDDETSPDRRDGRSYADSVAFLVEEGDGRDNLTPGSRVVRDWLVGELQNFAQPLPGTAELVHPFGQGTNVLGFVPGTSRGTEVVVLGAHYDGLGHDCPTDNPGDTVCDGAADNAAGVAAVLEIGRLLAADPPARSVVLALWDAEEDGLLGSSAALQSGLLDPATLVAYLNWDIQGVTPVASLADTTFIVGAETGGAELERAVAIGSAAADLVPLRLSLMFGQGRSDHATFAAAGVPVVFFTDGTWGCYHTAQDDVEHMGLDKLGRQIVLGEAVARAVSSATGRPAPALESSSASYEDAESMLTVLDLMLPELAAFPVEDRPTVDQLRATVAAIVDGGPQAFDLADAAALLTGTATLGQLLDERDCGESPD